jgi:hypothetical protein
VVGGTFEVVCFGVLTIHETVSAINND